MTRLDPGEDVAGYRVAEVLGVGGMGTVYLARDLRAGGRVALKVLPRKLAADAYFRRRFLREARYARSVEHPNVVRVLAAGEAGGVLYIAMDYVEGADLAAVLARERGLEARRAVRLLLHAALALDAIHAVGLIHRDVKPGNLIVTSSRGAERALVTDFGLSRSPATDSVALTAAGEFIGTPNYMAPEQIMGGALDRRADVYSLGCVLHECLTGQPPFPLPGEAAVLEAHVDSPPPLLSESRPDLPEALSAALARALAKAPAGRFESCAELMSASMEALGAAPTRDAARLRLEVTGGPAMGTQIAVEGELLLGRHEEGVGRLAGDAQISGRQARITRVEDQYWIADLESTNGTFVNGSRITRWEHLRDGDRVETGSTCLNVHLEPRPVTSRVVLQVDLDTKARRGSVRLDGSAGIQVVMHDGRWRLLGAPASLE